MKPAAAFLAGLCIFATLLRAEELPKPDDSSPLDIEPPLLIQPRAGGPADPTEKAVTPASAEQLQSELDRAKRSAAAGERLCRSGIIAKVEAEQRALKVVRLEADLAQARLNAAKEEQAGLEDRIAAAEGTRAELQALKAQLAALTDTARIAAENRQKAELDFALRNVHRQEKLLATGSGRPADVSRAREKLEALKAHTE